jgi:hypothetical protein
MVSGFVVVSIKGRVMNARWVKKVVLRGLLLVIFGITSCSIRHHYHMITKKYMSRNKVRSVRVVDSSLLVGF